MKYPFFFLFLFTSQLCFGQDRSKIDFQKDVQSVKTTLDGKKLIIKSKKWHPRPYGPEVRDYVIYDFESKSIRFFSEAGPYGGLSPHGKYFLNTKLRYLDMKRAPFKSSLLNLETGKETAWENENFALMAYDNETVLATKAKNLKSMARVEKFSTLYIHDLNGGKPLSVLSKKEELSKASYLTLDNVDADRHFFHLLSPDYLTSWGNPYNEHYSSTVFNWYDLRTGNKKEIRFKFPGDTTSLPSNLLLAVNGQHAILRRESRKHKSTWLDYFVSAVTGEKQGIANQDTHTSPAQYQMINSKIYQIDNAGTMVTRFETSSGNAINDKVWYPKISQALVAGANYQFAVASDQYLVAVPVKRTGEEDQVVIYDLITDVLVDSFTLHKRDKPKESVSSSYTTKKLYKSDLLNNYDRLSLPYILRNPSGREVTGLSGATSIGVGQVFAIGMIGTTAHKSPILLSLTRYTASNGSVVSTYYVSVFDENGIVKSNREIGTVQRSSAGRTFAAVNFKIQREQYNTFTIVGEQQFEQRKTEFKLTIEPSGNIH